MMMTQTPHVSALNDHADAAPDIAGRFGWRYRGAEGRRDACSAPERGIFSSTIAMVSTTDLLRRTSD